MTNIEQEFFKTFGIEPKVKCDIIKTANMCICFACPHYKNIDGDTGECQNLEYPEITDRILLQLIVIVTNYVNDICEMTDVEDLKKSTLEELIEISDRGTVKYRIQSLFREEGK